VLCSECVGGLLEDLLKGIVGGMRKAVGGEDARELVFKIMRNSFEASRNGLGDSEATTRMVPIQGRLNAINDEVRLQD